MKEKKRIGSLGLVRFLFVGLPMGWGYVVAEKKCGAEGSKSSLRRSGFYPRLIA